MCSKLCVIFNAVGNKVEHSSPEPKIRANERDYFLAIVRICPYAVLYVNEADFLQ